MTPQERASLLAQMRDIRPPVAVPDHSLWLLAAIGLSLAVAVGIGIYLWRRRRIPPYRRVGESPRDRARRMLKEIDWRDTKAAVYAFGEYLPPLIEGNEALEAEFAALSKRLEPYKYKKEVPPLDREIAKAMKRLIAGGVRRG